MYYDYFGISESPFSITPDPRYLYMSKGHHEALAHLLYGVSENGGFVLLTGEVGTGKTSVCRCLLEQLPDAADVALILNPRLTELELLAAICGELGIVYPKETASLKVMVDLLNRHLLEIHAKGRHAVVIVDEAQNLSPGVLEQVRLLTNLETPTRKLLQIVLIGQPELAEILKRKEMRQLAQRISAHYHLDPLSRSETLGYIRYRLAVGGLLPEMFSERAANEVFKHARGIPRLINNICDRSLLGAYAQDQRTIDRKLVRSAAKEVFGSAKATGREHSMNLKWLRWPAAAAAAALLLVVFTPTLFGLFAGPLNLGAKVNGLLFTDAEPEAAASNDSMPESSPAAVQSAVKHVPMVAEKGQVQAASAGDAVAPARKPGKPKQPAESVTAKAEQRPAEPERASLAAAIPVPEPPAAMHEPEGEPEIHKAEAPDAADTVLVPAAPPPFEKKNGSAVLAAQIARTPQISEALDLAATALSDLGAAVNGKPSSPRCGGALPSGAKPFTEPKDLFHDPGVLLDQEAGMAALFACWSIDNSEMDPADPCARSRNGGLECLRGTGSWKTLEWINRPALITLRGPDGKTSYGLVTALNGQRLAVLLGAGRLETDTGAIQPYWTGEYLILWRPPPIYYRLMARGARGKDVAWLKNRFAALHSEPAGAEQVATFDGQLHERVTAFQSAQGLKPDGIVGARTLIHINTAISDPAVPVLRPGES
jgi:general secretion pathway protein A